MLSKCTCSPPYIDTHTHPECSIQLFGVLCFPSVLVPLLTHTHTTLRYTVLSKCTCSPPYTHTHTQLFDVLCSHTHTHNSSVYCAFQVYLFPSLYRHTHTHTEWKGYKTFCCSKTLSLQNKNRKINEATNRIVSKFSASSHFSCHNKHINKALPKLYGLANEIFAASSTIRFHKTVANFETIIKQIVPTQMIELECQVSI
jgi:hypothetical protein